MSGSTGRDSDKFMLRLPDGMRERIKASADVNNRSMNAEIVATLEEKYPAPVFNFNAEIAKLLATLSDNLSPDEASALVSKLTERLDGLPEQTVRAFASEFLVHLFQTHWDIDVTGAFAGEDNMLKAVNAAHLAANDPEPRTIPRPERPNNSHPRKPSK